MSTRKPTVQNRAARPSAESLEGRQLLSGLVSGTDPNGNHWTLKLTGPGTLNVSDAQGLPFTAADASTPKLIDTITISGTDAVASHLIGTVQKAAGSDGRVFFQFLRETGGGELAQIDPNTPIGLLKPVQPKNGIFSINMPDFWLGNTRGTIPTPTTSSLTAPGTADVGAINIPDGTTTLQFGGVDATFTPAGGSPLNQDNQNDRFTVNLGTPVLLGTSIIINRSITDAQAGKLNATTRVTGPATQDSVYFAVAGRLNLFQANEIDGNTTIPPSQFTASTTTTGTTPGGTYVISGTGTPPFFFAQGSPTGALTGQIGFVRVGGNATNFTTMVYDSVANVDARLTNFSIGGETNNILVVAPNGARNFYFGKGMDKTQINAFVIDSIQANRGALDSKVTVSRGINSFQVGGDVVNTNVQSGYDLNNFTAFVQSVALNGGAVPTITDRQTLSSGALSPQTINQGHINARIAGDVVNSVFSASIEPNPSANALVNPGEFTQPSSKVFPFGSPSNIIYSGGVINAKVEGKIDNASNTLVAPTQPNTAFFAKTVHVSRGPVTPPNTPEAPYKRTTYHRGQRHVTQSTPLPGATPTTTTPATTTRRTTVARTSHPTGPVVPRTTKKK